MEPYSIAGQDGRIREGDQILQVNAHFFLLYEPDVLGAAVEVLIICTAHLRLNT